jgi:hypothetical protein
MLVDGFRVGEKTMNSTLSDLHQFTQFVHQRIGASDEKQVNLGELMDEWRLQNPTEQEYAENVAAVNAAIEDFRNGDRGRPAGELSRQLRESLRKSNE